MQGDLRVEVRLSEFNRLLPLLEHVDICGRPLDAGKFVSDTDLDASGVLTFSEADGTKSKINVFYGRED